ncbi:MAG: stage II sporulation protein M [Actinomycetia bacterium]|nr:stage II sporulation protein M [Actinomycetes bacterium]MCP4959441.1 stage II sporulation protein M [Actinomycetes bacterium]
MDVASFVEQHRPQWDRLEELSRRAGTRNSQLAGTEVDELIELYHRTSADLSELRTHLPDPMLIGSLTELVGLANGAIYGSRTSAIRALRSFLSVTLPAAVWAHRYRILLSAIVLIAPALAFGTWIANSDAALQASAPSYVREALVEEEFEDYYSSAPAGQFSTEVFINNVQVAFLAFALGITLGLGSLWVLAFNGANVGVVAGMMHAAGSGSLFWGLILPHGLLEISAIVVAGGAGLGLGWSIISPGDRTRAQSLADEGQRAAVIVLGLIPVFGVAALIEAFVTPSPLSTTARVLIGIAAFVAFWTWVLPWGRAAATIGASGRFGDVLAG